MIWIRFKTNLIKQFSFVNLLIYATLFPQTNLRWGTWGMDKPMHSKSTKCFYLYNDLVEVIYSHMANIIMSLQSLWRHLVQIASTLTAEVISMHCHNSVTLASCVTFRLRYMVSSPVTELSNVSIRYLGCVTWLHDNVTLWWRPVRVVSSNIFFLSI
jgi:hypothetical protein